MREPETVVSLDTPAGLVTALAACRDGKCDTVTLEMTPSFVEQTDFEVDVPGYGAIGVDLAFGGVYYALIDPRSVGLKIEPASARDLVRAGTAIHRVLSEAAPVRHPMIPSIDNIAYVMFVDRNAENELVGATILPPGRVDRSPCGTGNSARLAVRYARGEVGPGQSDVARSIIGSKFTVGLKRTTTVGDRQAVVPTVTGRAWIYGIHQIGLDPSDPYPAGFMLSDCWGDAFDLLP